LAQQHRMDCDFWNTLETIDLRYNQIRQDLLVDYTGLSSLKDLFLSHNSFSGSIPKSIGSLPRVEKIYLDHNDLIGTIPDDLVGLTRLMELKLSHNRQERLCVSEQKRVSDLIALSSFSTTL